MPFLCSSFHRMSGSSNKTSLYEKTDNFPTVVIYTKKTHLNLKIDCVGNSLRQRGTLVISNCDDFSPRPEDRTVNFKLAISVYSLITFTLNHLIYLIELMIHFLISI